MVTRLDIFERALSKNKGHSKRVHDAGKRLSKKCYRCFLMARIREEKKKGAVNESR